MLIDRTLLGPIVRRNCQRSSKEARIADNDVAKDHARHGLPKQPPENLRYSTYTQETSTLGPDRRGMKSKVIDPPIRRISSISMRCTGTLHRPFLCITRLRWITTTARILETRFSKIAISSKFNAELARVPITPPASHRAAPAPARGTWCLGSRNCGTGRRRRRRATAARRHR